MMKIRVLVVSTALGLATASAAWAASAMTNAPVPVNAGEDFSCSVANVGTKELASVSIVVHLSDGSTSVSATCTPLAPGSACSLTGFASGTFHRWCKVTGGSKKSVRGNFCNIDTGVCAEIH